MKTINSVLLFPVTLLFAISVNAQKLTGSEISAILAGKSLPQNLVLNNELQKYIVTTDHFNTDIFGNFFNKMSMKGRSHYWGAIWVSLEDKQIEHAVLYEDVVMEMNLPGQTAKQIMNAVREISFVKVI